MKTVSFFRSVDLAFAAVIFAFASQAQAQTTSCNGCTNTTPAVTGITVGGVSSFQGNGAVVFNGTSGYGKVIKGGNATMNITLGHTGNGCPGGCGDTQVTVSGTAQEHVRAVGAARSNTSGVQADVANAGMAAASVGFVITRPTAGQ